MIRTLFRRRPATDPAAAAPLFDPAATVDPESTDELRGAVPTWRPGPCPWFDEVVDQLGDPSPGALDDRVLQLVVDEAHAAALDEPQAPVEAPVEVPAAEDADPGPSEPLTRPLRLVAAAAGPVEAPVEPCPDCGAVEPAPCRPRSAPETGRPLPRRHRRRAQLADVGSASLAVSLTLARMVLLVVLTVLATLVLSNVSRTAPDDGRGPVVVRVPSPCPVPTTSGCSDGPR